MRARAFQRTAAGQVIATTRGVVNAKDLLPLLVNGKGTFELSSIVRPIARLGVRVGG